MSKLRDVTPDLKFGASSVDRFSQERRSDIFCLSLRAGDLDVPVYLIDPGIEITLDAIEKTVTYILN
jgi:hypothetical protein